MTEAGTLVGTSAARLMLPAGRHHSRADEHSRRVPGDPPGRHPGGQDRDDDRSGAERHRVDQCPPVGECLSRRTGPLGATPIANLEVALGTHEVIWRHPQLAERRQTVVVTAQSPLRLVMDLNK